ncbi:MAG: peptide chain release factor N(5)-glutamine methyltransferase [Candidatus Puniceispirillales bacterium]
MIDFFNSKELLIDGISKLKSSKIPNPETDARILLSHATNYHHDIYMHNNISISKKDKNKFYCFLDKRIQGKPVSRILGSRNFWKNNFLINKYTLDPRPDSEVIIDILTKACRNSSNNFQVLDLGSGSGCIGLSLIDEIKNASLLSVDICKQSLEILNKNANRLNLMNKLHCAQINWFKKTWIENIKIITQNEKLFSKNKFDIIVCNPPYIKSSDIEKLQTEVKNYDPLVSLDGGIDGCDSYRAIFKDLRELLAVGGLCLFEIGYDLLDNIKIILKEFNLNLIKVHKDFYGHSRVIEIS